MEYSTQFQNDLFLRTLRGLPVPRTPVWIMRQAGRYLPAYREVRARCDFKTLYKTPELLAEVTVQPVDIIGVDAAILFSDILVIPEAMGMEVEFIENNGPVFRNPLKSASDIQALRIPDPEKDLRFVLEGIRVINQALCKKVPLIGFSGSPWTIATYMIEGGKTKTFSSIKSMLYNEPALMHKLLDKISISAAEYLSAQIDAGVAAVQIFDTWGGILAPDEYRAFSLDSITKVIEKLNRKNAPVILYSKANPCLIDNIVSRGIDALSVDWTASLSEVRRHGKNRIALQGNLDPTILLARPDVIRREVKNILRQFGHGNGHVFNLGHGILPETPVEHAIAMVKAVRDESPFFHRQEEVKQ